jgi:hypothetical protein
MRPNLLAIASLLLATSVAIPAAATDAKTEAAKRYRDGISAYKKLDFEEARLSLLQAYALDPQPRYLWDLAIAETKANHPAEALMHLRRYLSLPQASDQDRAKIRHVMAEAESKTGHVQIIAPPGAVLSIDGQDTPVFADGVVDVMPGKHTVQARVGTKVASGEVDLRAGETVRTELMVDPGPASSPPPQPSPVASPPSMMPSPSPPAQSPPASAEHRAQSAGASWWTTPHTVGVVSAAGGGVALGLNLAFHEAASAAGDPSTHNTFAYLTWASFGVGAAAVATGVVLMLWPNSSSQTVIMPAATPAGAGIHIERDF